MMNYVFALDYFSTPYELKIYHKATMSTYLGLILTFIIFVMGVIITITQGKDLYDRTKPKVHRSIIFIDNPQITNLLDGEFPFSIRYDSNLEILLDKTYFNFKILNYLKTIERNEKNNAQTLINRMELQWEFCKNDAKHWDRFKKHLPNVVNDTYYNELIEFNRHLCLKDYNITVGGNYNSDYFSNVYIEISRCQNSTNSDIVCKSSEDINRAFNGVNLNLFYINNIIDSNNYTNPIIPFIDSYWVKLDTGLFYSNDIYFSRQTLISDNGLIFETYKNTDSWYFERFREISNLATSGRFLRLYINVGKNEISERRYYMKAQELAALVGGLIKILVIFGTVISKFFNDYKFDLMLINHLFKEEVINLDNSKSQSNLIRKTDNLINNFKNNLSKFMTSKFSSNDLIKQSRNLNLNLNKVEKDINHNKNILNSELVNKYNGLSLNLNDLVDNNNDENHMYFKQNNYDNDNSSIKLKSNKVRKNESNNELNMFSPRHLEKINNLELKNNLEMSIKSKSNDNKISNKIGNLDKYGLNPFLSKENDYNNIKPIFIDLNNKNLAKETSENIIDKNKLIKNDKLALKKIEQNTIVESDAKIKDNINKDMMKNNLDDAFNEDDYFFKLSILDILFMKICTCSKYYQNLKNKFECYKNHLYISTDYSEILKQVVSYKEFCKALNTM